MKTQTEKAQAFRALHERRSAFLIPNPWDAGSARLLEILGFEALATSSAGYAFSAGHADGAIGRDEMLAHCGAVVKATDLPVSGDLEKGFGDEPRTVNETIRLAAEAGLVGASIEDASGDAAKPIFDLAFAAERVRAAVEAARALAFPFTLTARAENFLWGRPDLKNTIQRLQAFQDAGADVLYAPGLSTREEIAEVVRSVDRPVNVLAVPTLSLSDLAAMGVRRVSVGSALARAAYGEFLRAAQEMREQGAFRFTERAVPFQQMQEWFRRGQ